MDDDRTTRHDEPQHGWAPDVGSGGSDRATEANRKAFEQPPPSSGPEDREKSEAEQSGVPPTDTEARTPLGVGESMTTRGEEYGAEGEEGRRTAGTKGESERPYGHTTSGAGIDPETSEQ